MPVNEMMAMTPIQLTCAIEGFSDMETDRRKVMKGQVAAILAGFAGKLTEAILEDLVVGKRE